MIGHTNLQSGRGQEFRLCAPPSVQVIIILNTLIYLMLLLFVYITCTFATSCFHHAVLRIINKLVYNYYRYKKSECCMKHFFSRWDVLSNRKYWWCHQNILCGKRESRKGIGAPWAHGENPLGSQMLMCGMSQTQRTYWQPHVWFNTFNNLLYTKMYWSLSKFCSPHRTKSTASSFATQVKGTVKSSYLFTVTFLVAAVLNSA